MGDNNEDKSRTSVLLKKEIGPNQRVKPWTNTLQEWCPKKDKWINKGNYRTLIPKDKDVFVGGDGAGLELRMLTHYLISISKRLLKQAEISGNILQIQKYQSALESAYTYRETLLEGDIHSHNQKLAGLPTRNSAKSFIYAFL